MSHIPATKVPHAQARSDDEPQATATRPEPEPTTATPEQPALGGGATPEPLATSASDQALDVAAAGPSSEDAGRGEPRGEDGRSTAMIAGMVLGGLAALGGLTAAVLPLLRDREDRKSKKGKKRRG